MHKFYLFDFDGTLVDSMPYWSKIMMDILNESKVKYPENILDIVCPLGYKGTAEYFINVLGLNAKVDDLVKQMTSQAHYNYINVIPLKEGVKDFLLRAKEKGISLNVLTASPHPMLDPCLKRVGVYDLFDNVWSCEDFLTTKTDPVIYDKVANKLVHTMDFSKTPIEQLDDSYIKAGVYQNEIDSQKDYDRIRAESQSAIKQLGNMAVQLVGNEILLGMGLGISNLVDMGINLFKEEGEDLLSFCF